MPRNLTDRRVLLASGSPRRRELLGEMGIDFQVVLKPNIDESFPKKIKAKNVAEYIATQKAKAYAQDLLPQDILIAADTVVIVDKQILGKPHTEEEARDMLRLLSGRTHKVITGVCISSAEKMLSFSVKTKVTMRSLSDEIIEHYVGKYKPLDKAGAYGIQEWIGLVGIDYIEGSYQNVMGLPTQRLFAELMAF